MEKGQALQKLKESGLVAVIRKPKQAEIREIAEALIQGGVEALEITIETLGALGMIRELKREYGDQVLVGAGTVLRAEQAEQAIEAGSDFIFSPNTDEQTIKVTVAQNIISIPGVMTPSEMVRAMEAGADIVKIFPATVFGPGYIKELQGPLAHIPMMPTGGVNVTNVQEFIRSGAVAVGAGGSLLQKELLEKKDYQALTQLARRFIEGIHQARKKGEDS